MKFTEWLHIREADWNMRPENIADFKHHYGSPEEEMEDGESAGHEDFARKLHIEQGILTDSVSQKAVFGTRESSEAMSQIGFGKEYTLEALVEVVGKLNPRNSAQDNVRLVVTHCTVTNDSNGKSMPVPKPNSLFKMEGEMREAPYTVHYEDLGGGDISVETA